MCSAGSFGTIARKRSVVRSSEVCADDRTARADDRAAASALQAVASISSAPADRRSVHLDSEPHRASLGDAPRSVAILSSRTRHLSGMTRDQAKRTRDVHRSPRGRACAYDEPAPIARRLSTRKPGIVQHGQRQLQFERASFTHELRIDHSDSRIDQHEPRLCRHRPEITHIGPTLHTSRSTDRTR
jgi:hypothetical protein